MLIRVNQGDGCIGALHGILRGEAVESIVSAEEARDALQAKAQQMLDEATARAAEILQTAQAQAESMISAASTAIDDAVRRGYEEGSRRAVRDWHAEQARKIEDKAKALKTMHETLAEIVTTAVERIVHTESRTALYQRALKNVQTLTRGATTLTLRVSAADHEHARDSLAASAGATPPAVPIDVVVDPGLRAGSCIFESDVGVLDASLETQLDGLRQAMERAVRKAAAQEPVEDLPEGVQAFEAPASQAVVDAADDDDDDEDFGDDDDDEEDHDDGQRSTHSGVTPPQSGLVDPDSPIG